MALGDPFENANVNLGGTYGVVVSSDNSMSCSPASLSPDSAELKSSEICEYKPEIALSASEPRKVW